MESSKNKNSLREGYLLHWYEIKRVIGRGGFGITYLAHDSNLDRNVAIKEFMPEEFATRESDDTVHPKTGEQKKLYEWGLDHFIKEAQTLAKFNHPNIVQVLSVFEENNTAYMIMEYAQGEDLSTIYKKQPTFTEEQFLDTFIPIMDGLALVHRAGFIHRDIKPANIYIREDNSPLLLDFGSARQPIDGQTKALTSLVTYGYAPFEQYSEGTGKQGPWTDIYALGACIHVGITGQKPVDSLCRGGSLIESGADIYQPLSVAFRGEYSDNFLLAIDNALMFKINQRPQNIFDWADMLLGKTQAPDLPEIMFKPPTDDKTVIQATPAAKSRLTTAPSRGTQGLVDPHGKRNNDIANSSLRNISRRISEKSKQEGSGNNISTASPNKPRLKLPTLNQFRLPLVIGSSVIVILLVASGVYIYDSSTPVETETTLETQQLELLLSNAKQALSQKKYVTPDNNNAYYFYLKALKLEPNNEAARKGIKEIESQLFILAKRQYDDGNLSAAQQYIEHIVTINPKSKEAKALNRIIQNKKKSIAQLTELLSEAEKKLNEKKYTIPENDSAFYYYQKIISLDPGNPSAKRGIKNIEELLYKRASSAHVNKKYKESLNYLAQIISINSESKDAIALQNKINKTQSQYSQIKSWLNKANTQRKNNKYTSPKNDNAYETYNKILKLQPGNKQALDGLKNIQWHYKAQFNRHISASQLSKASHDIGIMKNISAPSSTIKQMQATLKNSRQKKSAANDKKVTSGQVDIQQASKKIGQFKTSIENHNKNKLKNLSQYTPGREQFVDQLFGQYHRITVKISGLQLIPKENKVKAQVELTNLVDINNKNVTPGSWSKFEITVKYNNKQQIKVHW